MSIVVINLSCLKNPNYHIWNHLSNWVPQFPPQYSLDNCFLWNLKGLYHKLQNSACYLESVQQIYKSSNNRSSGLHGECLGGCLCRLGPSFIWPFSPLFSGAMMFKSPMPAFSEVLTLSVSPWSGISPFCCKTFPVVYTYSHISSNFKQKNNK